MINMDILEEILKTTIWTGWVKNEKPVSLLIVAKPEEGKTSILEKAKYLKGIVYLTDTTAFGIATDLEERKNNNEIVNHIIIPDMIVPLSKQRSTRESFYNFMNPLIEEGLTYIKTGAITLKYEFRCGVISALTTEKWKEFKRAWLHSGFISRFVPVTYTYSMKTVQKILESVVNEDYQNEHSYDFNFPDEKVNVELDKDLARRLVPISTAIASAIGTHGIRLEKSLQRMMKAHALMNGRTKTIEEDYNAIANYTDYMNYTFRRI